MLKHPWVGQTFKKHSGVEPYCSQKEEVGVSSREHSVQTDHRSLKRWALAPSTVQKINISCGGCVDKTFFSLWCPAVPPISNAGKVYDWHRPGDGVPQQQELHPQRPRCSQLHVSTILFFRFFTLSVPVCVLTCCFFFLFYPAYNVVEENVYKELKVDLKTALKATFGRWEAQKNERLIWCRRSIAHR